MINYNHDENIHFLTHYDMGALPKESAFLTLRITTYTYFSTYHLFTFDCLIAQALIYLFGSFSTVFLV